MSAIVITVAAVVAIALLRTHQDSATDASEVPQAVRTVVTAANTGDISTLSTRTCGDLGLRIADGDRQVLTTAKVATDPHLATASIDIDDFHYTTVVDDIAYTYARVQGKLGSAAGIDQVALFGLARTDNLWKVCTATIVTP
ncbi:Rv0361 family membrane protein [Nocardia suismassiliense]|uniref:Rv0361 family membrane protein n=1 Tax=Nocardia suismassiliense TaxID=2077092 RepID=UPI00131ED474|nr:hypothetical protein [Nocardia suismassiliense]